MQVTLTRRWAMHPAGKSVEVSDTQGRWLVQHSYAESVGDVRAPEQRAAAEGTHGADPLAGGDATRRYPRALPSARDKRDGRVQRAPGSSPTYRAGYGPADAAREGEAGRDYDPSARPADDRSKAAEGSVARAQQDARDADADASASATAEGDSPAPRRARRTRKTDEG
jgi:hypothetical protein